MFVGRAARGPARPGRRARGLQSPRRVGRARGRWTPSASLTAQAALAVESARLFADTERRRRSAEALASVSQALAHSLDPRQVAHLIADNVLALLGARDVTLFELQPRYGRSRRRWRLPARARRACRIRSCCRRGVGASGRAVRDAPRGLHARHPRTLRASSTRRSSGPRSSALGYRAVVAVPLLVNGEPIGALGVAARPRAGRGRGVAAAAGRVRRSGGRRAEQRAAVCRRAAARGPRPRPPSGASADLVHGVDAVVTEVDDRHAAGALRERPGRDAARLSASSSGLTEPGFWRSRVHPDDRARVLRLHRRGRSPPAATGPRSTGCWPPTDGWCGSATALTFRAADRLHCLKVDVTERKRTEALLAGEKRVLEMIAGRRVAAAPCSTRCAAPSRRSAKACTARSSLVEGDRAASRRGAEPARAATWR